MPTVGPFPTLCTEIAGIPVVELARRYTTPFYVYDAAKIVERIDDLRAFDVIRYAQKACSNLAILDLVRKSGAMVDTVSAGEIRRALAAGYAAAWRSAADRLHGGHFRRRVAGLGPLARDPCQCRFAGHDRAIGRSRAGAEHHAADQSRLWAWTQPEDEYRRRAIQARHLARTIGPLSAARGPSRSIRHRACICTLVRARTWSTWHRFAARWKRPPCRWAEP